MAGMGGWVVEAAIRYTTNGIGVMERLAYATDQAAIAEGRLTRNITAQEAAFARLRLQQERTYARQKELIAGVAGGVAVVGAVAIGYAADQAAKLQQILLSVRNETGATANQIKSIYTDVFNIANQSGMTPIEAGEIFRSVSRMTAGQMSIAQMRAIAPAVADFASMVHFNRPDIDVNQAALTGLSTAHLFRAYNAQALVPLLDKVYRLSGLMGETPDQALRQMSYFEPMFKGMHIGDEQSLAMMALLDRAGFRNKVGTNVRAMLLEAMGPLQLTSHAQRGKLGMLRQMGLLDAHGNSMFDTSTGFNFIGMLLQLSKWEQRMRSEGVSNSRIQTMLYGTFGRQGGTVASLMADPQMVAFLGQISGYLGDKNVSLAAGKKHRDDALTYQFGRTVANFQALATELPKPWLDDLANFFKKLADSLNSIRVWLQGHGGAEKAIGGLLGGITAFAATVATVGAVSQALRFLGIIQSLPNALSLTLLPMRAFLTGVMSFATSGTWGAAAGALGARGAFMVALSAFASNMAVIAGRIGLAALPLLLTDGNVSHQQAAQDLANRAGSSNYLKYLLNRHRGGPDAGDAYSFDTSRGDLSPEQWKAMNSGVHVHVHGPVVVKANDPKHFGHELQKTARHAAANAGVLKSLPRVNLGTHGRFIHAT